MKKNYLSIEADILKINYILETIINGRHTHDV